MKALRVDFGPPSPWLARLAYAGSGVILMLALWQGEQGWRDFHKLRSEQVTSTALRQQLSTALAYLGPPPEPASAPAYERDAREIARVASFDVGGTLRSIESAQVAGAMVLSIDIDARARSVALALEVTNADVAKAYIEALNAGDEHPKWALARLQSRVGGDSVEVRGVFP